MWFVVVCRTAKAYENKLEENKNRVKRFFCGGKEKD